MLPTFTRSKSLDTFSIPVVPAALNPPAIRAAHLFRPALSQRLLHQGKKKSRWKKHRRSPGNPLWLDCARYSNNAYRSWVIAQWGGVNYPVGRLNGWRVFPDGLRRRNHRSYILVWKTILAKLSLELQLREVEKFSTKDDHAACEFPVLEAKNSSRRPNEGRRVSPGELWLSFVLKIPPPWRRSRLERKSQASE